MKKKILFCSFIFCFFPLFASDYDLPNVDSRYIGTYIPVDYENHIKREKNIYGAYPMGYPNHHDVLFVGRNRCYADAHFHDGYAIKFNEFKNFRFVTNDAGTFCVDDKGNSYHQISNELNEKGYGYNDYYEYVMNLLFDFVKDMNTVEIDGDILKLDGESYRVNLDWNFFDTKNVVLWLFLEDKGWYAIVKNGVNGELHESYRGEYRELYAKPEVIKTFPLMFLKTDKNLTYYSDLPKDQYRYLRNLIYARHGYIFKSADLNEYFSKFNWYKPNPNFSEDLLTNEEKDCIEYILKNENGK